MELTLVPETSAFKTQTPGNNPEDCILYPQHGESLKSTISRFTLAPLKMELTLGSETSAFKTQTPGNNPEDCTLYSIILIGDNWRSP
jgi:hypothetical protein